MRKLTGFWLGYLCLALITACVRKDEPLAPGGDDVAQDGVGEAEITLPALPAGFLAKAAADSSGSARAYFILTITGPGMAPRRHAWPLDSGPLTVRVTNIPVGNRLFTGGLDLGGGIVYGDSAWAIIEKGKTALVHLKLGSITGNAQICVEIEGLPPPQGCRPVTKYPDVSGCWSLGILDTAVRDPAILRISQWDGVVLAELRMGSRRDTVQGTISTGGWLTLVQDSSGRMAGNFLFTAQLDSAKGRLQGKFAHRVVPPQHTVYVDAFRVPCVPDTVKLDSLTCWNAMQRLKPDTTRKFGSRYIQLDRNGQLYGVFLWIGFDAMPVRGFRAQVAGGNTGLYLYGAFPQDMLQTPPPVWSDSAHYKGQIVPGPTPYIAYGTVNDQDSTGAYRNRGVWSAEYSPCVDGDRRVLQTVHGL